MSKKTTAKKPTSPLFVRRKLIFVCTTILVLITACVLLGVTYSTKQANEQRRIAEDQKRLEDIALEVKDIHTKLVPTANNGTEWEYQKYCSQGSTKFDKPLTICGAFVDTSIKITTIDTLKSSIATIKQVVNSSDKITSSNSESSSNGFLTSLRPGYHEISYRIPTLMASCVAKFVIKDSNRDVLNIHFNCSDYTEGVYFPRIDT